MTETPSRTSRLLVLFASGAMAAAVSASDMDWPEVHAGFKGATFVKDAKKCVECHEEDIDAYRHTAHGKAFGNGPNGDLEALDCESCHGPRSKHVEDPDDKLAMTAAQYSQACLQCHQEGDRMYWKNGAHAASDVGCTSCHDVMKAVTPKGLLAKAEEPSVCYTCHADVRGQMQRAYHHPVREGRMACSSCHNPHGSAGPTMLRKATVNETCYSCHQEKRGPFLWEHAVVREDCATCHDVHGSNNRDLLQTKGSFLCLQCHSYGGHINLPRYNRVSNPTAQGCVNCHITQHGSNHPSGAKFTR